MSKPVRNYTVPGNFNLNSHFNTLGPLDPSDPLFGAPPVKNNTINNALKHAPSLWQKIINHNEAKANAFIKMLQNKAPSVHNKTRINKKKQQNLQNLQKLKKALSNANKRTRKDNPFSLPKARNSNSNKNPKK